MTVEQENERAIAAENTIVANLNNEVNRATAKENELAGSIQEISTSLETMRGNVSNALDAENGRAEAEEQRIEGRIDVQKWGFNVTDIAHLQEPIVLEDAVLLVPISERKPGMKITFWTNGGWQTWQFYESLDVRYWPLPEYWHQEEGITDKLLDGAVTSEKIKNGAVTTDKLQDAAVKSGKIAAEAVVASKIAAEAVTSEKIKAGAVTNDKLPNNVVTTEKIKGGAVTTGKIADEAVTPEKVSRDFAKVVCRDLQNQIDAMQQHGVAVSNKFGDNPHIGISQATLTEAWNNVYHLLEEALGRTLLGFTWTVTPTYIFGEWPTTVHVSAQPTNQEDVFEYIRLSVNNVKVDEVEDVVSTYAFDIDLQATVNIRMDAQVLGRPYYRAVTVNHYDSFWLGAGTSYASIMDEAHNINLSEGTRLTRDITANDNDHIYVVVGDSWVPAFIRADIGGVEIPFTSQDVTIDGHNYKVFTSENVYNGGIYNIDING